MTQHLAVEELRDRASHVADRLSLLANANRLLILCRLVTGEASVSALQQEVGLSQSALSQHLARLRMAGVVATRREAQTIYYRIADVETQALMDALYQTFCGSAVAKAAQTKA